MTKIKNFICEGCGRLTPIKEQRLADDGSSKICPICPECYNELENEDRLE